MDHLLVPSRPTLSSRCNIWPDQVPVQSGSDKTLLLPSVNRGLKQVSERVETGIDCCMYMVSCFIVLFSCVGSTNLSNLKVVLNRANVGIDR